MPALQFGQEFRSLSLWQVVIFGLVLVWSARFLYKLLFDPLRNIPGPFLTRFTRLWELHKTRQNQFELVNIDLHQKYGPVVRLAPNRYSISDPPALKIIYGHGSRFTKSTFYLPFGDPDPALANLFSERNIDSHAAKRRRVSKLYAMSTLVEYEPFVDQCIETLCRRMKEFAIEGGSFDVPTWMQFYAYDVIGEITFSKSFGFMEVGKDVHGILPVIDAANSHGSRIGLLPELHPVIASIGKLANKLPFEALSNYSLVQINSHHRPTSAHPDERRDFVAKLLQLKKEGHIEDKEIMDTINANIGAGSDTTATSLSSVIYHLVQNPSCEEKLRQEIKSFTQEGKISDPVQFKDVQQMPYLQAVIKEALRLHPGTGQILARVVPPEGATLAGRFFPGGTVVGVNSWVINRHPDVFGPDATTFRPERWFGPKDKLSMMEQSYFTFGAGARACVGKNISLMEISKAIPHLYRNFEFELCDDGDGPAWTSENIFFVKQSFKCKVRLRRGV